MNADEDQLSDNIVRLMHKGVYLKATNGDLKISGNESSIRSLDPEDTRLLSDRKIDVARLITLNSEKLPDGVDDQETFEGRFLGKHLVRFWQGVESGKFDEFFTNLTHSVCRLPRPISHLRFLEAARLVVDRHPALRLTLSSATDESYRIGLADPGQVDVRVETLPQAASYDWVNVHASELISEKLDNRRGMVRLFLLQHESYSLLGVVINHFVSDLRSVASVTRQLISACYGQPVDHSKQSAREEREFVREISDLYDYSLDSRFALARAFWRDVTFKGCYRKGSPTAAQAMNRSTNIKFYMDQSTLDAFIGFTKKHGVTPLNLLIALHASAQQRVFGYSTTISVLTTRSRCTGSTSVGKMDDVKPVNVRFHGVMSCAKEVAEYRRNSLRFRFLPFDAFPQLFYGGELPLTPFLNLVVGDNVGNREFFARGGVPSNGVTEATTFESGADQRFDFEDYSLQVTTRDTGIYGTLSFPHDRLSEKDGEALVSEIIRAFEDLVA